MKDFQKLLYSRDGSQLNLSFDLLKMEGTSRVVIGFATLDNVDFGSDIVAASASLKAFSNFRGNVRVQHDKLRPVGRVLDFKEATYFDEKTQKEYKGIEVAVYISKGAEDVWEMCQDGTLSGFSIGGAVLKASKIYKEDINKTVQVIDEYALLELSLVDSPMNEHANIYSIHKSLDSIDEIEKGYNTLNLFYCGLDKTATKSIDTECICPICGEKMVNFGQTNEDEEIGKSLEKVFEELKNETKGGHPTMEENEKEVEAVEVETAEVESNEAPAEEVVEVETAETEETKTEKTPEATDEVEEESAKESEVDGKEDVAVLLTELRELLEESSKTTAKSQDELRDEIKAVSDSIEKRLSELTDKYVSLEKTTGDIKEKLNTASEELEETKKRLDVVGIDSTPIKKSLDSVQSSTEDETSEESLFKGLFTAGLKI